MSLKDARATRWEVCLDPLRGGLHEARQAHADLWLSPALSQDDRRQYVSLLDGDVRREALETRLRRLTGWLHGHHRQPAALLVDEDDAPIEPGHTSGFHEEVLDYIRNLLSGAL